MEGGAAWGMVWLLEGDAAVPRPVESHELIHIKSM